MKMHRGWESAAFGVSDLFGAVVVETRILCDRFARHETFLYRPVNFVLEGLQT